MEEFSVLMIDCDSDWTHSAHAHRKSGRSVVVLVRQWDERSSAFHQRAAEKIARLDQKPESSVVHVVDLSKAPAQHLVPEGLPPETS
jgi:hypothetical protein